MTLAANSRGSGSTNAGGESTLVITPVSNSGTRYGSMMYLCVACDNSGAAGASPFSSIVDSVGNVWTLDTNAVNSAGNVANDGVVMLTFFCYPTTALTTLTTITITFNAVTVARAWTLTEVTCAAGKWVATPAASGGSGSGSSTTPSVTASPAHVIGDIVLGFTAAQGNAAITADSDVVGGSWSAQQTSGVGVGAAGIEVASQNKVVTATTAQTYNTVITSALWITRIRGLHETTPFPDADTGTATDAGESIAATLSDGDTATVADAGESVATTLSDSDSATVADAGESVGISDPDTGTVADAGESVAAALSDTESAAAADTEAIAAGVTDPETASVLDAGESISAAASDTEAGAAVDTEAVGAALADDDPAAVGDTAAIAAVLSDAETATAADAGEAVAAALTDTESAAAADAVSSLAAAVSTSDASNVGAQLLGTTNSYWKAPDSAALSITGDIEWQIKFARSEWLTGGKYLLTKDAGGGQFSWDVLLGKGPGTSLIVQINISEDGTNGAVTFHDNYTNPFVANLPAWIRLRVDLDDGFGVAHLYVDWSTDGATWTSLGVSTGIQPAPLGSIFDSTADIEVGAVLGAAFWIGSVEVVRIYDGIGGTLVADPDFGAMPASPAAASFTDDFGNVWTNAGASPLILQRDAAVSIGTSDVDTSSADDTESIAAAFTDSEGGLVDETAAVNAATSDGETASADDAVDAIAAQTRDDDSVSVLDTEAVSALLDDADSSSAADAGESVGAALVEHDGATAVDGGEHIDASGAASVADVDTASAAESEGVGAGVTTGDNVAVAETAAVAASTSDIDDATAVDAGERIGLGDSDTAFAVEVEAIAAVLTDADSAVTVEEAFIAASVLASDFGLAVDDVLSILRAGPRGGVVAFVRALGGGVTRVEAAGLVAEVAARAGVTTTVRSGAGVEGDVRPRGGVTSEIT